MAGLLASAVVAVSVTVVNPAQVQQPVSWTAPASSNLASTVQTWAASAGVQAPQIDPQIAAFDIGKLSVKAQDYCSALSKLVSALSYANPKPRLVGCSAGSQSVAIVASAQPSS
jgi:hypothetical protein